MKIEEPASQHFVALCIKYPEFSFNLPKLRQYRIQRDYNGHDEKRVVTGTVAFQGRLLDTKERGFDEEEARIIHEAIKARSATPIYGVDIVERGQSTLSETPYGQFQCGTCKKKYETMDGLTKHYDERHKQAA